MSHLPGNSPDDQKILEKCHYNEFCGMKKLSGNSADFFLLPPTSNSVFMRKPPYRQRRKNPKKCQIARENYLHKFFFVQKQKEEEYKTI